MAMVLIAKKKIGTSAKFRPNVVHSGLITITSTALVTNPSAFPLGGLFLSTLTIYQRKCICRADNRISCAHLHLVNDNNGASSHWMTRRNDAQMFPLFAPMQLSTVQTMGTFECWVQSIFHEIWKIGQRHPRVS